MYGRFTILAIVLMLVAVVTVEANDQFFLRLSPGGTLPLGQSTEYFSFGAGTGLSASYSFGASRIFGLQAGFDYLYLPLVTSNGISIITAGVGPLITFSLTDRLSIDLFGDVGYYYWFPTGWEPTGDNGGGLKAGGGATVSFRLSDSLSLGAGAGWDYYAGLYNGLRISLGTIINLSSRRRPGIDGIYPQLLKQKGKGIALRDIVLDPVFPVLYKFYDNSPLGTALLYNKESTSIEDIVLTFFVERYMDNPMDIQVPDRLGPDEEMEIDLFGLFTEDVLEITEGTKASAKLTLSFTMEEQAYYVEYTPILELHNRNALTWDDDRKVCAFVTSKDPVILEFSKNITSWMQEKENLSVDINLQKGMALFEAVKAYGIRYEIDPTTPFAEYSKDVLAIDFLQFPRQTLNYTNGDCDDLSVLFTALLEAAGVETAFITVPGHIFMAFGLKIDSDEARKTFYQPDNLIFRDNKAWIPIEITMFQESFQDAWQTGAREWREFNNRGQAVFFETGESWNTYQAVGFREGASRVDLPGRELVVSNFSESLRIHIDREISFQVERIKEKIRQYGNELRYRNRLAVLYARYGILDQAERYFKEVVSEEEYLPALVNLGNISFLRNDYKTALEYYERAYRVDYRNKTVLLCIARTNHELENYSIARRQYNELKLIDPDLAQRFAYLGARSEEAARAADVSGVRRIVVWEEEE